MLSTFLFYGIFIFLTAFLGGIVPLSTRISDNNLKICVSLGGGLLLGMACIHMIPESAHLAGDAFGVWVLAGFVLLLILERFVMVHACEEHGCDYHTIGIAAFLGLAVHGIIEGFALASSLLVSEIGPFVLVAIISHKAPAGFALTSILRLAGRKRTQIILFSLGVALSVPFGMAMAYAILKVKQLPATAGILLSLSSGTFLYIAACDLLPELHRTDSEKFKRLAAFLLGLTLSLLSGHWMEGHHH